MSSPRQSRYHALRASGSAARMKCPPIPSTRSMQTPLIRRSGQIQHCARSNSHATRSETSDQLTAFPAQVGALGGVLGGGDRGVVRLLRLGGPAEPAEQVGTGDMPCVVAGEWQPV